MKTDPSLSELLIARALKGGADMAEVWQRTSRHISADAKESSAEAIELASSFSYSLRIVKKGRLGFAYSNTMDNPDRAVDTALSVSLVTEHDEFFDFPEPSPAVSCLEIMDPAIASITEQDAIQAACSIESAARGHDARITKLRKATASFESSDCLIVNSKGVFQEYASTLCSGSITVIAEDGGDSQVGWRHETGRFMDDISFKRVGREAAQRALWLLHSRRMQAVKAPVFMESTVVAELLSVFASMLSSESVQKGKSLLWDRAGQKVLSDMIDISDDGLIPRGPGSRRVDDEGVPSQTTSLIEQGKLLSFLYNTRTAKHDNVNSTGNAVKGSLSAVPSVGVSNFVLSSPQAGATSNDIVKDIARGLFVVDVMGMHMANLISGDFSLGVSGLWIEQGTPVYPVKETVISGNLLELFRNVEAVGNDVRFYGNIGAPGVLFRDTDISA
jgi:PmbA protein